MKIILPLILFAALFSGCSTHDELKEENEKLRAQNRELRKILQQTRRDTNRKQIHQLQK